MKNPNHKLLDVIDTVQLKTAALTLAPLAKSKKQNIFEFLNHNGPTTVAELAKKFELERPHMTSYLHDLRKADLIMAERESRSMYTKSMLMPLNVSLMP